MMPVVICEPGVSARAMWLALLEEISREARFGLRLEVLPGARRELCRMLEAENGVMLVILAVGGDAAEIDDYIELYMRVMERNRDNYVLLCVHDPAWLDAVLSRCMRPAGVMVVPFREELMRASLRRIFNDYASLHAEGGDAEHLLVQAGKTVQRIAYRDILYLEAQDKLLHICTRRQVVSVRASLNALEQALPQGFVRCHRSYIVNRAHVEQFDLSEMTLRLSTNERLPVSRSCKDALRAQLQTEGHI